MLTVYVTGGAVLALPPPCKADLSRSICCFARLKSICKSLRCINKNDDDTNYSSSSRSSNKNNTNNTIANNYSTDRKDTKK